MDKYTIVRLAPQVLKRMEYGIDIFYLLNLETDEIWTGNIASALFVSYLDGKRTIFDIANILSLEFPNNTQEELCDSLIIISEELINKNFLQIIA